MAKDDTYVLTPLGLLGPEVYERLLAFMLKQERRDEHAAIILDYDEDTGKKKLMFRTVMKVDSDPA